MLADVKVGLDTYIKIDNINNYSLEELFSVSSDARKDKARQYTIEAKQKTALLGEYMLKSVLATLNIPFSPIMYTDLGKPYINVPGFHFNISHSDKCVVLGYGEKKIGVDVEIIKKRDISFIQDKFHKYEVDFIHNSIIPLEDFYTIWTLKESFLKAIGVGLYKELNSFYILPIKDGTETNIYEKFGISVEMNYFKYEIEKLNRTKDRYVVSSTIII